jgi:galactokinase
VQALAHNYVHAIERIAAAAVTAIERGDPVGLARQMTLAQEAFDAGCLPNCPSQLTSPRLHTLMADAEVRALCLAMKGVGSQGDGSAQILCGSVEKQEQVRRHQLRGGILTHALNYCFHYHRFWRW